MANEVGTIGVLFQMEEPATPGTFVTIGGVSSVPTIGSGAAAKVDVTALEDLVQRTIKGYKDTGETTIPITVQKGNTRQKQLDTDAKAPGTTVRNFRITDPAGTDIYITFAAYCSAFQMEGPGGDAFRANATLVFDGEPQFPILDP